MKRAFVCLVSFSALLGMLGGCGNSHMTEVRSWMAAEKKKARPTIKPLPEPKSYVAVEYVGSAGIEPFNVARLLQALNAANANGPTSALYRSVAEGRRKQPLEAYPLDSMQYVGMLQKGGSAVALVKVDNLLYQVRVGDFMGQNFGRVLKIDEGQVALLEVAQDAAGEWVERNTTLNLQEGSQ